jgi:hypothetical protein
MFELARLFLCDLLLLTIESSAKTPTVSIIHNFSALRMCVSVLLRIPRLHQQPCLHALFGNQHTMTPPTTRLECVRRLHEGGRTL